MQLRSFFLGALLLIAAPAFSQEFQLSESRDQIRQKLGQPSVTIPFGDFESWQFKIGVEDHDDYSHQFVFRRSTGEMISFTRTYEAETNVDELFPASQTKVYFYPDAQHPEYGARVRVLPGGRLLLAMGSTKPGEPTSQLMIVKKDELRYFMTWLSDQLK